VQSLLEVALSIGRLRRKGRVKTAAKHPGGARKEESDLAGKTEGMGKTGK
jgi:hypothetical protein